VNAEFGESQNVSYLSLTLKNLQLIFGSRNALQLAAQHGYLDIFRTLLAEQASADHIDARDGR